MNNIDTRTSFFPGSKTSRNSAANKLKQTALKRNNPARMNELKSLTQNDAKVEIGDAIKDFSRIKKAVDASPDIDNSAKIARLKAQIQKGTYKIDYDALADKMLQSEL